MVGRMRLINPIGRPIKNPKNFIDFLIVEPPTCICGQKDYSFTRYGDTIRARCKICRYDRYYNSVSEKWGPLL